MSSAAFQLHSSRSCLSSLGVPSASAVSSASRRSSSDVGPVPGSERSQRSSSVVGDPLSEITLRQASTKSGQLSGAERSAVADRVVAYLRSRHPAKTAEHVAAESGVGVDTVQKWLDRGSMPSGLALCMLIGAYGPDFLRVALPKTPAWLDRAAREERLASIQAQIDVLKAEEARLSAS